MTTEKHHFSTRDLLMMAALAALGGITSTYINAVGDFFQSILGFAGTTQWAAGLHVLWLVLAVGLTGKGGAGTFTGTLKGAVELLTGNTHGVLVVLIDIIAGLLVDLGFFPFRKKDALIPYAIAGGLAAVSNVLVFQLFASLPTDILAYGALFLVGSMAFLSGAVLAGTLGFILVNTLRRSGVVKDHPPAILDKRLYGIFLAGVAVMTMSWGVYLHGALQGPTMVQISGAVFTAYTYPEENGDIEMVTAESTLRDVTRTYTGIPVRALVDYAQPLSNAELLLVRGLDGYAFFISMDEVATNDKLLLSPQGSGHEISYNLVGAGNSKAWVRGISELAVIAASTLEISGALGNPVPYDPDTWQFDMDSISLDVGDGPQKLQGAPLGKVLESMQPGADATSVVLHTGGEPVTVSLSEVLKDDEIRIFTVIGDFDISFAVAYLTGEVIVPHVTRIEVR